MERLQTKWENKGDEDKGSRIYKPVYAAYIAMRLLQDTVLWNLCQYTLQ